MAETARFLYTIEQNKLKSVLKKSQSCENIDSLVNTEEKYEEYASMSHALCGGIPMNKIIEQDGENNPILNDKVNKQKDIKYNQHSVELNDEDIAAWQQSFH